MLFLVGLSQRIDSPEYTAYYSTEKVSEIGLVNENKKHFRSHSVSEYSSRGPGLKGVDSDYI